MKQVTDPLQVRLDTLRALTKVAAVFMAVADALPDDKSGPVKEAMREFADAVEVLVVRLDSDVKSESENG